MDGIFGTRQWMQELGRRGGATKTSAKSAAASRERQERRTAEANGAGQPANRKEATTKSGVGPMDASCADSGSGPAVHRVIPTESSSLVKAALLVLADGRAHGAGDVLTEAVKDGLLPDGKWQLQRRDMQLEEIHAVSDT